MATTTTNFGWDIPQSTDLVKNGATAIAELGQDIDTTMVDLKGGTSGQVLSKASNTDMDFVWVAQDDSNAIQNAIVDAKGDLIAASANDTPARLAVGANGTTLVADSSQSTGLGWVAKPSSSNPVLNSAFNVWQRGTSISIPASTTSQYSADRWHTQTGASQAVTISRQGTADTTNFPFVQYCARVQRNSGQTGTGDFGIFQSFETINSIPFAGKTVTYSFYARAGANFSATSNALKARLYSGTGIDQNLFSGYTGLSITIDSTATLTTTWQRFTFSATVPVTSTELTVGMYYTPTGTASTNDYFEVTGVQLDIGSVALPFRTAGTTYQQELAACQRYYQKSYTQNYAPGTNINTTFGAGVGIDFGLVCQVPVTGTAGATRGKAIPKPFAVTMRTTPTARYWDSLGNLSKYSAYNNDGTFISGNNSFDTYGGLSPYDFQIGFQTVAASSTHIYCVILWEASAEL